MTDLVDWNRYLIKKLIFFFFLLKQHITHPSATAGSQTFLMFKDNCMEMFHYVIESTDYVFSFW